MGEAGDIGVVGGAAHREHPEVQRGAEEVDGQAHVDVAGQFGAVHRLAQQGRHRRAPGGEDRLVERVAQGRVAGRLGHQIGDDPADERVVQVGHGVPDEAFDVVVQGTGAGRLGKVCGGGLGDQLHHHGLLGGPAAVEGCLADAGPAGDGLHRHPGVPGLGQFLEHGAPDRLGHGFPQHRRAGGPAVECAPAGRLHGARLTPDGTVAFRPGREYVPGRDGTALFRSVGGEGAR